MRHDRPIHVLIVEDDKDQAWSLKQMLENRPEVIFTSETAQTNRSALIRLEERGHGIEIVMLDLGMPDGSGLNIIPDIKKLVPGIRVVVYSGIGDWDALALAALAGADDVIIKPSEPSHIVKVLQWQVIHKRVEEDRALMKTTLEEVGQVMKEAIPPPS